MGVLKAGVLVCAALAVVSGAACSPDIADGSFLCGSGGQCPPGFTCGADGRCWRSPVDAAPADAIAPPDAAPDAGRVAPEVMRLVGGGGRAAITSRQLHLVIGQTPLGVTYDGRFRLEWGPAPASRVP